MAPNHNDDVERNASTAGRSKSIVSLTALDGLDEYSALQRYILLYRDPKAQPSDGAAKNANDAGKGKHWWQFWRSGSSPNAVPGMDPGAVPEDVCTLHHVAISPTCPSRCGSRGLLNHVDMFLADA
jgi:H+-transporting ATPase